MSHPILRKYAVGGEPAQAATLAEALTRVWPFDAYIVQYTGDRRLNRGHVAETPMVMTIELYDFDAPNHEPITLHVDWVCNALERLPEGFQGCATAGGFRVWTCRAEPFVVRDSQTWEEWRAYHAGRALALGEAIGAEPDPATNDPGRLFRLPNVKRDDGKPCYPELFGTFGVSDLAPKPVPVKAASEFCDGDPSEMLVARVLAAARIDECPWQHEHTNGAGGGTVVFPSEDGLGVFHCAHAHCVGRSTTTVIDALKDDPRVWPVLEDWGIRRQPPEPVPIGARFIRGPELALEAPPPEWLIAEMEIAPGRPPILSANAGGGKTWAMQSIALSVAHGLPVFGRFTSRKVPVLHISRDSSIGAVKRRYQKLAIGLGVDLSQTDITVFPHRLPLVDKYGAFQLAGFKEINEEASKGYGLVILDSIVSICAGLEENSVEIAQPLAATYDEKCVWWWAHHNGKNGGYRGSSALMGVAGAWWAIGEGFVWESLKRSEDTDGGELPSFQTTWEQDPDGGARIVAADLEHTPEDREETKQECENRIRTDIIAFFMMKENDLGASAARVEASIRGKGVTIRDTLKTLCHEGVLVHSGQRYGIKLGRG